MRRFGFGTRMLAGPAGRVARASSGSKLNDSALASVSMGYQIGVTPLQMATAVSSIANGGELMRPHLVRAVIRERRRACRWRPKALRRTITPETAAELTTIMEGVVERGTAQGRADRRLHDRRARPAPPPSSIDGAYSKQKYISSFVGFLPSRKPAHRPCSS